MRSETLEAVRRLGAARCRRAVPHERWPATRGEAAASLRPGRRRNQKNPADSPLTRGLSVLSRHNVSRRRKFSPLRWPFSALNYNILQPRHYVLGKKRQRDERRHKLGWRRETRSDRVWFYCSRYKKGKTPTDANFSSQLPGTPTPTD